MGAAAFWIALAAVLITGGWWKSRSEAMKHETIRRVIERTGQVDDEKLKALFEPHLPDWVRARLELIREIAKTEPLDEAKIRELLQPPPPPWDGSKPGDGYTGLRVGGTIIMFIALGIAICFSILHLGGMDGAAFIGPALASVVGLLGAGLFYSSRFCEKPPPPKGDRA